MKDVLSIPLWSDFINPQTCQIVDKVEIFQSHYGLILSIKKLSALQRDIDLSIPLWSDFIFKLVEECELEEESFQSHYGLILSSVIASLSSMSSSFQSHFGLILSRHAARGLPGNNKAFNPILVWFYRSGGHTLIKQALLSIPFWSDFIKRLNNVVKVIKKTFNPILVWFYRKTEWI